MSDAMSFMMSMLWIPVRTGRYLVSVGVGCLKRQVHRRGTKTEHWSYSEDGNGGLKISDHPSASLPGRTQNHSASEHSRLHFHRSQWSLEPVAGDDEEGEVCMKDYFLFVDVGPWGL